MLGTVLQARKVTTKIHFLLSRGLLLGGDKANQQAIIQNEYDALWVHAVQTGT